VIASDPGAGVIAMGLVDSGTHRSMQALADESGADGGDFSDAQQLALLRALHKLQSAGIVYQDHNLWDNVFLPVVDEGASSASVSSSASSPPLDTGNATAIVIDYGPVQHGNQTVWVTLLDFFLRSVISMRRVAALMRDHPDWFGFPATLHNASDWAQFLESIVDTAAEGHGPYEYSGAFEATARSILDPSTEASAPAAGAARGRVRAATVRKAAPRAAAATTLRACAAAANSALVAAAVAAGAGAGGDDTAVHGALPTAKRVRATGGTAPVGADASSASAVQPKMPRRARGLCVAASSGDTAGVVSASASVAVPSVPHAASGQLSGSRRPRPSRTLSSSS